MLFVHHRRSMNCTTVYTEFYRIAQLFSHFSLCTFIYGVFMFVNIDDHHEL